MFKLVRYYLIAAKADSDGRKSAHYISQQAVGLPNEHNFWARCFRVSYSTRDKPYLLASLRLLVSCITGSSTPSP